MNTTCPSSRGLAPWANAKIVYIVLCILDAMLMHTLDVILMHILDVLTRLPILDVLLLLLAQWWIALLF